MHYVDESILTALKELSKKTRVPASQYVQEALEDLLKKYNVDAENSKDNNK